MGGRKNKQRKKKAPTQQDEQDGANMNGEILREIVKHEKEGTAWKYDSREEALTSPPLPLGRSCRSCSKPELPPGPLAGDIGTLEDESSSQW